MTPTLSGILPTKKTSTMSDGSFSIDTLLQQCPVIPVVSIDNVEDALPTTQALQDGGINAIEVTLRTPTAYDTIEALSDMPNMFVGAGTVINKKQADDVIKRGASFVVSPGFLPEIAQVCQRYDIPFLPGAVNPTAIMRCLQCGYSTLKFFPAQAMGGLAAVRALAGPFPQVTFVPTGGINPDNLAQWLRDPNVAGCGGTWIAPRDLIREQNVQAITQRAKDAMGIVTSLKQ